MTRLTPNLIIECGECSSGAKVKSAYYLYRWFHVASGGGGHVESEKIYLHHLCEKHRNNPLKELNV